MANLSRPRFDRSDDRAQIMLVAGFVLAVTFIALAVMLNSVIYTENLATRGEDAHGSEAIAYRADAVAGTEQLIEHVNENQTGESFDNHVANLTNSIDSMDNGSAPILATGGTRTRISLMSVRRGTHIGQFNASRNFTDIDADRNWVLANSIEGTRAFRINITDSTELVDDDVVSFLGGSIDPFTVRAVGSSDWAVRIYEDDTTADVIVDIEGAGECVADPDPEIDLTAGTIDGEPCGPLAFGSGVSAPYALNYEHADKIQGNFSVVVETTSFDGGNYDADEDTPFADDEAIYAATIHVLHESADHIYATDARAIPGENDA